MPRQMLSLKGRSNMTRMPAVITTNTITEKIAGMIIAPIISALVIDPKRP